MQRHKKSPAVGLALNIVDVTLLQSTGTHASYIKTHAHFHWGWSWFCFVFCFALYWGRQQKYRCIAASRKCCV